MREILAVCIEWNLVSQLTKTQMSTNFVSINSKAQIKFCGLIYCPYFYDCLVIAVTAHLPAPFLWQHIYHNSGAPRTCKASACRAPLLSKFIRARKFGNHVTDTTRTTDCPSAPQVTQMQQKKIPWLPRLLERKKKQSRAFALVTGMVSSISSVFLRTGDALKISSRWV